MTRESKASQFGFISIPGNEKDPRCPSELINISRIEFVQIFSSDSIRVCFASENFRIFKGDRARKILSSLRQR